jgi:helicase
MEEKSKIEIEKKTTNPVINIALDTIKIGKQALVFVGTRQSAEKAAEEISFKLKTKEGDKDLNKLAEDAVHALTRPTKQCERLGRCIRGGTAFHHSGLTSKQRQLIEDNFRSGKIKIICSTPTLAAGVDLPAFRAVVRDLKRFSGRSEYGYGGSNWIPVLEYLQMCGRAGRPSFDTEGQAILLADSEPAEEEVTDRYINGEPEPIFSKLAVEPVLRTYLLSLIATKIVRNKKEIMDFFTKTFWAHQFKDFGQLEKTIEKMLFLLDEWEFIRSSGKKDDFISASELDNDNVTSTILGERVAELYIDPLTAHEIIKGLKKAAVMKGENQPVFPMLHLISSTLEMRPLLRVKVREVEDVQARLIEQSGGLLSDELSTFEEGYDEFLSTIKTSMFFEEWIDEKNEEYLLEKYGIRPGEIHAKLNNADWLIYSAYELTKLMRFQTVLKQLAKLRFRVKNGVKEELLPLLQLKGIGRVRARKMFDNRLKTLADVKKADISTLTQILKSGKLVVDVKEQLGQKVEAVKERKRKGQISLKDYNTKRKSI